MRTSVFLASTYFCLATVVRCMNITYDNRAFIMDGKRTLLIGSSLCASHNSSVQWTDLVGQAKSGGTNLVQIEVHWDIHEPLEGTFHFPSDGTSSDIIALANACRQHDMYVNLRFGPFFSAERSSDGYPDWLRSDTNFRYSTDVLEKWGKFVDAALAVVANAGLFASDGGPVVMLQVQNGCGDLNSEGDEGACENYIDWVSNFVNKKNLIIPWIMPQQGANVLKKSTSIIHTCTGYNCEEWIGYNTNSLQPLMWTNADGADEAFALARWYTRGGSYALDSMYFDKSGVQTNAYGLRDEEELSLLKQVRHVLLAIAPVLLAHNTVPAAVPHATNPKCDSIEYTVPLNANVAVRELGNISIFSNRNIAQSCSFQQLGLSIEVPPWSLSIVSGAFTEKSKVLINTRVGYLS